MKYSFRTKGVCSREIEIEMENGVINEVRFIGGCSGNTQGVASLAKGRRAKEVIALIKGINCNGRGTSCPDQLAKALEEIEEDFI
ncbi:MAG: TIGR03905 family TSCPD domain-containing protein [Eubacteriales bacterium]|nr:TIGR03905 family TSCPD domain-containing protein [Eubacteriales bacterium]